MEMRLTLARLVWEFDMRAGVETQQEIDWESEARFEGFWNIPAPFVCFDKRADD